MKKLMLILNCLFLFVLGLSIGSFLNVLIDRIPQGSSIIRGRSRCDCCRHQLSWHDLIPLVSFLLLKSRCRYCHRSISWQYPVVELITGLLFVYTYFFTSEVSPPSGVAPSVFFAYLSIMVSGLIVVFFTDLKYRIIPDQIILSMFLTSTIYLFFSQRQLFTNYLLSGLLLSMVFLALVIVTRGKGMGLGDVKFSFIMGLLLGPQKIIVAFYLSFLTGAVFSLILVILGKKTMKSTIPFGPFLALSTLIALFYGQSLWDIAKGFLGI